MSGTAKCQGERSRTPFVILNQILAYPALRLRSGGQVNVSFSEFISHFKHDNSRHYERFTVTDQKTVE
jgi:hypothetical protein